MIDAALRLRPRPEPVSMDRIRAAGPRRVLVVRPHNEVGDFLLATPALAALREAFPDADLRAVVAPIHRPLVRNHPDLDGVFVYDKVATRRPWVALRFLKQLRAFAPELAIVLNTVSFSATSAWIAVLSGARWVVGSDSRPFGWTLSRSLYSSSLPTELDPTVPAVERSLRPLRAVGIAAPQRDLTLRPDDAACARAAEFLESPAPGRRVAVHVGAGKPRNRWPVDRFARVVTVLRARGDQPWLVEGPADASTVGELLARLDGSVPVLRGVDLDVVAAAIARSDAALVNDTGVLHVAAAVRTPTVALFGPTSAAVWAPPGDHVRVVESEDGTMRGIAVEPVLAALESVLGCPDDEGRTGSVRPS